jgi:hypothetical protein
MSKEEPLLLPLTFACWMWIDRCPMVRLLQQAWPSFAAVAVYLALRARTDAFTPASAPSFYRLSLSPDVLLPNAMGYVDRSMTFTAAVLIIGLAAFVRTRLHLSEAERRAFAKGLVWLVLGFGVTIMIPVRSSLYVVFPTVGSALIGAAVGTALWRSIPERRRIAAIAAAMALPIAVLPIHWARHRETKAQAMLSTRILDAVRAAVSPSTTNVLVLDDPGSRPTAASAFGAELPHAVELVTGRRLPAEIATGDSPHQQEPPGTLVVRVENGDVRTPNPERVQ